MSAGKGSRDRANRKKYAQNYDSINWSKKIPVIPDNESTFTFPTKEEQENFIKTGKWKK